MKEIRKILLMVREAPCADLPEMNKISGRWNGYIGIPEGHKLYGVHYDLIEVNVHGGLTYSREELIDEVKYWVIGFDCAHYSDSRETCTLNYVFNELSDLLSQLEEMTF